MADDPFVTWDGAYVLGALSPEDRHAFEAHLRGCDGCTRRVQQLAGLPGLLARADPADLGVPVPGADDDDAPPPTLLPRLLADARRDRMRRRWLMTSGWAAAAAAVVALVITLGSRAPASPTPASSAQFVAMTAAAGSDLSAEVSLTGVTWGTKIELKCTYPADDEPAQSYELVVIDRAGTAHPVGGWQIVPGKTATMNASTAVAAPDIRFVQVSLGGQPVLTRQF